MTTAHLPRTTFCRSTLEALLGRQDGVVTRSQLTGCGAAPHDIKRLTRRRELVRLLPGVFVDHTGTPTWMQRAWAGVLHYQPAALDGMSALRARAGPHWRHHDDAADIAIAVHHRRTVAPLPGYRVRRMRGFDEQVQTNLSPPRVRLEDAVLETAAGALRELDAIALLADVCQARMTTAHRLLAGLERRSRIERRQWLSAVLRDVRDGTCSVLEHGYRHHVVRAHGLPVGRRQAPDALDGRPMFRDVELDDLALIVELDGRLFHDSSRRRDHDLDRDLDAAASGRETVRLGWGQVFDRPCVTAARLVAVMRARGWAGVVTPCGTGCVAGISR